MKKLFGFILVSILLMACASNNTDSEVTIKNGVRIQYLDSARTAYTRCLAEDTVVLDGRTFIKVWGVSSCMYKCPVLIEVK